MALHEMVMSQKFYENNLEPKVWLQNISAEKKKPSRKGGFFNLFMHLLQYIWLNLALCPCS